jgi:hypothetical protein
MGGRWEGSGIESGSRYSRMGLLPLGLVRVLSVLVTKSDLQPSSGHVDLLRVRVDDGPESCAWGRSGSSHGVARRTISGCGFFNNRVQGCCRSHSCHGFIVDDTFAMLVLLVLDVEHLHGFSRPVTRTSSSQVEWCRSGQSVIGLLHDDLNNWLGLLENDVFGLMVRMRMRRRVLVIVIGWSVVDGVLLVDVRTTALVEGIPLRVLHQGLHLHRVRGWFAVRQTTRAWLVARDQRRGVAVEIMAGELVASVGHRARYRWQELDIAGAAAGDGFGSGSVSQNSGGEQQSLQQK